MLQMLVCKLREMMKPSTGSQAWTGKRALILLKSSKGNAVAGSLLLGLAFASMPTYAADAAAAAKFVKIANDGSVLPESAVLGAAAKEWACTRDSASGLIWEVKATSGLRNQNYTYTWYNSDKASNTNGRAVGVISGGFCATEGRCDTEKFVADVNASGLCGARDWRMPKSNELEAIFAAGRTAPEINQTYFPNSTGTLYYWTGSQGAYYSFSAWAVASTDAQAYYFHRSGSIGTRLVRNGQ